MARPNSNIRKEVKEILFCCEGETEQNYLKYVLKNHINRNDIKFTIKDYDTIDGVDSFFKHNKAHLNPVAVIRFCDLDRVSNDNTECAKLKEFEEKNSKKTQYKTVYTYPCLEFWYLLHFEFSASTNYTSCDSVIAKLKKHIPTYKKPMPTNANEAKVFITNIDNASKHEKTIKRQDYIF